MAPQAGEVTETYGRDLVSSCLIDISVWKRNSYFVNGPQSAVREQIRDECHYVRWVYNRKLY